MRTTKNYSHCCQCKTNFSSGCQKKQVGHPMLFRSCLALSSCSFPCDALQTHQVSKIQIQVVEMIWKLTTCQLHKRPCKINSVRCSSNSAGRRSHPVMILLAVQPCSRQMHFAIAEKSDKAPCVLAVCSSSLSRKLRSNKIGMMRTSGVNTIIYHFCSIFSRSLLTRSSWIP